MKTINEIMELVFGLSQWRVNSRSYLIGKAEIKAAIEELVREVEYNKQHTLIECPQCGFTGAREYAPKETQ